MMKNLIGILFLSMFLSGCVVTASSGTRTEYEDNIQKIERDYREKRITKEEYIQLKNQASQQRSSGQTNDSMHSDQNNP